MKSDKEIKYDDICRIVIEWFLSDEKHIAEDYMEKIKAIIEDEAEPEGK